MNDASLFNEHWYRFKDLTPNLASDVQITRHLYRDQVQYILHRKSTGGYFRLDANSFEFVGKLDGTISIAQLWELTLEHHNQYAPTQSDVINILAQLHDAELLVINKKLNAEQVFSRGRKKQASEARQRYLNPLFLRFKLFDPDRLLTLTTPYFSGLFTRHAFFIWLLLLLTAIGSIIPHWHELKLELSSFDYISPRYAAIFLIVYPALKFIHEMAHGIAVKFFGGEVHEFGIALMVLMPIPYVDASAAVSFSNKHQRMIVSAAGIMMELSVAIAAMFVWLNSDGMAHDAALVLMIIGGISTFLINGNPLLRFDGYYVLADSIEIPDLATKSKKYLRFLTVNFLRLEDSVDVSIADAKEQHWLIGYGVLSSVYRVILMLSIAYLLSGKYFIFGAALAIWIVIIMILLPVYKFVLYISNRTTTASTRSLLGLSGALTAFVTFIALIPLPLSTVSEGVVWLPSNAIVRGTHDCHVTQQFTKEGTQIAAGDSLFSCQDPDLVALLSLRKAELRELEAERYGNEFSARIKRTIIEDKINTAESKLKRIEEQIEEQTVIAQVPGRLVFADDTILTGRFIEQGNIVAYIVPDKGRTVHVAVNQNHIHEINQESPLVEMRFIGGVTGSQTYTTSITHRTHQASYEVPSTTLTNAGGGRLLADPNGNGKTVLNPVFNLELSWPKEAPDLRIGSRVKVRFYHGAQPVLSRIVSRFQRTLMRGNQA